MGLVAGGLAGFYGGWTDTVVNIYVTNAFLALPGILLAIAFVAFMGPGLGNVILALAISGWVGYARLVRAQVMAVKEREFVEAARALGATDLRVMTRHILPNILQPLIVQAAIGMAGAVLAEATLSFLGLGVPPPAASWGSMLNDARSHLFDSPHLVFFPAMAVMLCVLSFNFIGDALRDYLDPRTTAWSGAVSGAVGYRICLGSGTERQLSMRKSIVSPSATTATPISDLWRDLERIARVEISSEDQSFRLSMRWARRRRTGWRAAATGPQLIRLHFDEPHDDQADASALCR